jgi:hypothetical protein
MAGLSYIGNNRFDSKVAVKAGGAEVTGSLSVDGAFTEQGYSIPVLIEKLVVDENSTTFFNFTAITDENDGAVVTN